MISVKYAVIIAVGAFAAGSFFASPLPEAIAAVIATDVQCTGCVGTSDLASMAVTNGKLGANSVGSSKIADGTVLTQDIATNGVTASDIAATAVGSSEIATGAVGTSEIADGTITGLDLSSSLTKRVWVFDDKLGKTVGWDPDGSNTAFFIEDANVNQGQSTIIVNLRHTSSICSVSDVLDGGFRIDCDSYTPNGTELIYTVINNPNTIIIRVPPL